MGRPPCFPIITMIAASALLASAQFPVFPAGPDAGESPRWISAGPASFLIRSELFAFPPPGPADRIPRILFLALPLAACCAALRATRTPPRTAHPPLSPAGSPARDGDENAYEVTPAHPRLSGEKGPV
ncbi:hypothetical protein CLV63_10678 [Murinocardiopsis flavida]|uniref:Secreted protein n=1 Tax=Murinocardiopsis flavida TaxID=645275 RepID=A0A2P8DLD9_9ACTN|nr:hypothetical protein [Murinocardiopsis flavida]PSK98030.1 hypothetical protein CLV63_10678 [Murinocardiopsis flavida]